MPYKLRYVQKFNIKDAKAFLNLEKKFEIFEKDIPNLPKTNRYLVLSGAQPTNTLIWECNFETLEHLNKVHEYLNNNNVHADLFNQQAPYILESFTEIYEPYNS